MKGILVKNGDILFDEKLKIYYINIVVEDINGEWHEVRKFARNIEDLRFRLDESVIEFTENKRRQNGKI